jgi:hypothetical protein
MVITVFDLDMIGAATPWRIWLAISTNRSPTIWRAC